MTRINIFYGFQATSFIRWLEDIKQFAQYSPWAFNDIPIYICTYKSGIGNRKIYHPCASRGFWIVENISTLGLGEAPYPAIFLTTKSWVKSKYLLFRENPGNSSKRLLWQMSSSNLDHSWNPVYYWTLTPIRILCDKFFPYPDTAITWTSSVSQSLLMGKILKLK